MSPQRPPRAPPAVAGDGTETTGANQAVARYWNPAPCGTHVAHQARYSRAYFDQIEAYRYAVEPQIHGFAQFSRFHGSRVLEVGVGAGTDFVQWVRCGAKATGVDLTPEAIEHTRQRLAVYGLAAEELRVVDAEELPFPENSFDLVYSWGVIHHAADTVRILDEIIRVTRPGGAVKLMVYNRHSLGALYLWLRRALFAGQPWRSVAWCLARYQESPGTKAYTAREMASLLARRPAQRVEVRPLLTYVDTKIHHPNRLLRTAWRLATWPLWQDRFGWFLTIQFVKTGGCTL